jgi:hypothetical protein
MPEAVPNPELAGLEAALKGLAPASVHLDRDRLLFRAGQAAVRRRVWLWPSAAAILALTTVSLAVALALRPAPGVVERTVVVRVPVPAPPAPPPPPRQQPAPSAPSPTPSPDREDVLAREPLPEGYLRLRDEVLRWGVDALPSPPPVPAGPPPVTRSTRLLDLSPLVPGLSWFNFGGAS